MMSLLQTSWNSSSVIDCVLDDVLDSVVGVQIMMVTLDIQRSNVAGIPSLVVSSFGDNVVVIPDLVTLIKQHCLDGRPKLLMDLLVVVSIVNILHFSVHFC